jgi:hypothetical protein
MLNMFIMTSNFCSQNTYKCPYALYVKVNALNEVAPNMWYHDKNPKIYWKF